MFPKLAPAEAGVGGGDGGRGETWFSSSFFYPVLYFFFFFLLRLGLKEFGNLTSHPSWEFQQLLVGTPWESGAQDFFFS